MTQPAARRTTTRRRWALATAAASAALLTACGSSGQSVAAGAATAPVPTTSATPATPATPAAPAAGAPTASPSTAPAAKATIFASATPPNAPTQTLTLYHVDVPPGAVIAPHQHPGQQVSHVTSGTLTYTVMAGAVTLVEAPVDGKPGPSRVIAAPATIEVTAGQSLTEPAGEIHRATNVGSSDVRIDIAVLVPQGDPISVPAG